MKMPESSRSYSPIKKKVKRSKLARTATTKTTLKCEWKKKFLSSQMMLWSIRDITETAHINSFFVILSNVQYFC